MWVSVHCHRPWWTALNSSQQQEERTQQWIRCYPLWEGQTQLERRRRHQVASIQGTKGIKGEGGGRERERETDRGINNHVGTLLVWNRHANQWMFEVVKKEKEKERERKIHQTTCMKGAIFLNHTTVRFLHTLECTWSWPSLSEVSSGNSLKLPSPPKLSHLITTVLVRPARQWPQSNSWGTAYKVNTQ